MNLETIYKELIRKYSNSIEEVDGLWNEIVEHYTEESRQYHNLEHLENLYTALLSVKTLVKTWEALLFTMFYHDIVYNATKSDNEEQSAFLAVKRMEELGVSKELTQLCNAQILATKSHQSTNCMDTNYFTDADLCVLGQSWVSYFRYIQNIREEYKIYPDIIYKPGRKKVVKHFLNMDRIYKTDFFFIKYEAKARENLQKELEL